MKLFEPGKIGKLSIKNRIVMAAMAIGGLAEPNGSLSQRSIDYYVARAKGGVGLIITGGTRVSREVEYSPNIPESHRVDNDSYLAGLSELAKAVHDYGAKVAVQINPAQGRNARLAIIKSVGAVASSALPCFWDPTIMTRELTIKEIERLIQACGLAAEIIRMAGIDAIELNAHGGYIIDEFTTSLWNRRTDKYGGDLDSRLRFSLEIIEAIKRRAGADFPLIYKFGLKHYLSGGREVEEGLEIARRLEMAGVDALDIDAGCYETYWCYVPTTYQPPGCLVDMAEKVKQVVNIPVMAVGKLGYPELAESVLQEGKADFIALGRPLLADPEWPNKVKEKRLEDIIPCVGDGGGCSVRIDQSKYISCTLNPATGMEREFTIGPAKKRKSVLVVGGGPGGMETARVAALRGHKVTLWERGDTLGGNLVPASIPDFKQDYRRLISYLSTQIKKLGVNIELRREATLALIEKMNPRVVFIATGSTPIIPKILGVEKEKVVTAIDLLLGRKEVGELVVVVGGGVIGCETAVYLAQMGKKLTVVEILDDVMRDIFIANRMYLMKLLADANVEILTSTNVLEITEEGLTIADKEGRRRTLKADTVVLAVGFKPNKGLLEIIKDKVPEVYAIGDCVEPRKVIDAIWEGFHTARLI